MSGPSPRLRYGKKVKSSVILGSFVLVALFLGSSFVGISFLGMPVPALLSTSASSADPPIVTLSTPGGIQGSTITVTAIGLGAGTYTVCFSPSSSSCQALADAKASYSETATSLASGVSLNVPDLYGGEYFVNVLSGNTFVANAAFAITPATVQATLQDCSGTCYTPITAGLIDSSIHIFGNDLATSGSGSSYYLCFSTYSTSCIGAPVVAVSGSVLESISGYSTSVPIVPAGPYYIDVRNGTSSNNIVASTSFFVNGSVSLSSYSGAQGSSVTVKSDWVGNAADTYTVCFSVSSTGCSAPTNAKASYSVSGTSLASGTALTVPDLYGGQYVVDVLSGSSVIANTVFSVTSAVTSVELASTPVQSAGIGASLTVTTTNLATSGLGSTYVVCVSSYPTTCSGGTSFSGITGSTLASGYTLVVPSITVGPYYVDIGNGTINVVSSYSLLLTGQISLSTTSGSQGSPLTITASNLDSGTSYKVCFSESETSCNDISHALASFTFLGSSLVGGVTIQVPDLPGGQYFVNVLAGSTLVENSMFSISPTVVTLSPNSLVGASGGTVTVTATGLYSSQYYFICLSTSEGDCSDGVSSSSLTGSQLGSGQSFTVAGGKAPGLYYVSILNSTQTCTPSPSCYEGNYVGDATLILTSGSFDPMSVSPVDTTQGGSVTVTVPSGLTGASTYTVCFSYSASSCSNYASWSGTLIGSTFSESGSSLSSGVSITVPDLWSLNTGTEPQWYVVVESGSTVVAAAAFDLVLPALTLSANSGGIGTSLTITATNLVPSGADGYEVCFSSINYGCDPTTGAYIVGGETGPALASGATIAVPDVPIGKYYVVIANESSSGKGYNSVAFTSFEVTGTLSLSPYSAAQGSGITVKDSSLASASLYTLCFSVSTTSCSGPGTWSGNIYGTTITGLSGASLTTGATEPVPDLWGLNTGAVPQWYVNIESSSNLILVTDVFSLAQSSLTLTSGPITTVSGSIGSTVTVTATNLATSGEKGSSYELCFSTVTYGCNPVSGNNIIGLETGSSLVSGLSINVPNIPAGPYYVVVTNGTTSGQGYNAVARSSFLVSAVISPGSLFAGEKEGSTTPTIQLSTGAFTSIQYGVCFSYSGTSCDNYSSWSGAIKGSYLKETGASLTSGVNIPIPDLWSGNGGTIPQWFVNVMLGSSVLSSAILSMLPAVESFPSSGSAGSSATMTVSNLNLVPSQHYEVCFSMISYGCNPATGANIVGTESGSSLSSGVSITVPSLTVNTPYYVDVTNGTTSGLGYNDIAVSVFTLLPSTGTSVSCLPNPVDTGASTTCTATVTGTSPTGTVTFTSTSGTGTFNPTNGVCTLTTGQCQVSYSDTTAGTFTITAKYGGDSSNAPSSGNTMLTVQPVIPTPVFPLGTILGVFIPLLALSLFVVLKLRYTRRIGTS